MRKTRLTGTHNDKDKSGREHNSSFHSFVSLSVCALTVIAVTGGCKLAGTEKHKVYAASENESSSLYSEDVDYDLPSGIAGVVSGVNATPAAGSTVNRIGISCDDVIVGQRKEVLEELVNETRTIILYEAPHKLVRTLRDLRETLGNRRMTLCRELTKKHETAFHSTIDDLLAYYEKEKPLGECVLVIEGKSRQELKEEAAASWEEISIEEHMEIYEKKGMSRKDAMKQVAKDRGVSKRDIYSYLMK